MSAIQTLQERLDAGTATIGVIGLGYVGLPLVHAFASLGRKVIGFDIDAERVAMLNAGTSDIDRVPNEALASYRADERFEATDNFDRLAEVDAINICVPTPLDRHQQPDLSYVEATGRAIAKQLRPGQLIVLQSTSFPGTTAEVLEPLLTETGLKRGEDFLLAFSPEREDPGNPTHHLGNTPKVVGADDQASLDAVATLFEPLVPSVVKVSTAATAEAVKLTENIFRSINIALVNELKVIYARMGIDIWEVIEGAKSKPFGFMPFYPGPGLGGHCIPIDPFYLTYKAREYDLVPRFIELAGQVNMGMPYYVIDQLATGLEEKLGKTIRHAEILVIGTAYKKNVGDTRESPSLKLLDLLISRGAKVRYHDPHVPVLSTFRHFPDLEGMESVDLATALPTVDAVVISTDHDAVDYGLIADQASVIVDTRNAMRSNQLTPKGLVLA
ncbi:MAG: nucleotide sugar dehydrogenase [Alphaproteobacteria bacterium]|nr:nucleotide sugar dehydrogenase [Alphaproteobacteria bacterium SS10]